MSFINKQTGPAWVERRLLCLLEKAVCWWWPLPTQESRNSPFVAPHPSLSHLSAGQPPVHLLTQTFTVWKSINRWQWLGYVTRFTSSWAASCNFWFDAVNDACLCGFQQDVTQIASPAAWLQCRSRLNWDEPEPSTSEWMLKSAVTYKMLSGEFISFALALKPSVASSWRRGDNSSIKFKSSVHILLSLSSPLCPMMCRFLSQTVDLYMCPWSYFILRNDLKTNWITGILCYWNMVF